MFFIKSVIITNVQFESKKYIFNSLIFEVSATDYSEEEKCFILQRKKRKHKMQLSEATRWRHTCQKTVMSRQRSLSPPHGVARKLPGGIVGATDGAGKTDQFGTSCCLTYFTQVSLAS